jgi:hypothetical protein
VTELVKGDRVCVNNPLHKRYGEEGTVICVSRSDFMKSHKLYIIDFDGDIDNVTDVFLEKI